MKITILSQYFSPEPVEKVVDEASCLQQQGHEVEVLTSFPCYPQGKIYSGYRQSIVHRSEQNGVRVVRVPQFPDHSRSAIRRALYYLSFAFNAMVIGPWFIRRSDVMLVYQSALPTGIAAWWISRVRAIPYLLDVVDLWPESVVASGMLRNRFLIGVIRFVAQFVYSRANHISVITEGYRDRLIEMGIPAERISVIYHWKRSDVYGVVRADDDLAEREGLAGHFNVMYTGNVGPCQSLSTLVECAEKLQTHRGNIQFVIVGDGLELSRLQDLAAEKKLTNIRFLGRRPTEQIPDLSALADALLVHLETSPMAQVSIPSKTISYLACGRPILMGVAGEATRFVEKHQCGIGFVPQDANSLAEAVLKVYHASPEQQRGWSEAALRAFEANFKPDRQLDKMMNELIRIARPGEVRSHAA